MKIRPKKALLIGLASTVLFSASGCGTNGNETTEKKPGIVTEDNEPVAVYGPPPDLTEEKSEKKTEKKTEEKTEEKTEAPKPITTEDNIPVDVDGPPEDF